MSTKSYNTGGGGSGGGTPISILFQILGIDQAKTQLQSIVPVFAQIDAAAKAAGVDLTALGTGLKNAGASASGLAPISTGLQKIATDEQAAATAVTKTTQTMTQQNTALGQTGTAATTAAGGVQKIVTADQAAEQAASKLATSNANVKTSMDQTGQSANTLVGNVNKIAQADNTAAAAEQKIVTTEGQVKTAYDQRTQSSAKVVAADEQQATAGQQVNTVNTEVAGSTQKLAQTQGQLASEGTAVTSEMKGIATAEQGTVGATNQLTSAFQKETTELGKGTGVMQNTTKSTQSLKESFSSAVAPMTALVASGVSLFTSIEEVSKAQVKAEVSSTRAAQADLAVEKAQIAYNAAVAKFGPDSEKANIALESLNLKKEKASAADAKAEFAQTALSEAYLNFAQQVLPNVLSVVANVGQAYEAFSGTLTKGITAFKANAAAAAAAAVEQGTMAASTRILGIEVSATSKMMALAGLTNPFFIALTVGGALLAAFVSNLGGFRDMINGIGVALGNAIPGMRGILELIGGFGDFLTKSLGGATDATQKFGDTTEESLGKAGDAATATQSDFDFFNTALAQVTKDASGNVTGFSSTFVTQMGNAQAAPKGLSTATETEATKVNASLQSMLDKGNEFTTNFLKGGVGAGTKAPNGLPELGPPKPTGGHEGTTGQSIAERGAENSNKFGFSGALPEGLSKLTNLFIQQDKVTKQLYVDQNALTVAMQLAGVKESDRAATVGQITSLLGVQVRATTEAGDANKELGLATTIAASAAKASASSTGAATGAHKENTGAVKEGTGAAKEQKPAIDALAAGHALIKSKVEDSTKSYAGNVQILSNASLMEELHAAAITKADAAMAENQVTLIENIDAQNRYAEQLGTTAGQQLAFGEGALAEATELNKVKASVLENEGALALLTQRMSTGQAQVDAFNKGFTDQELAFKKSQLALSELGGTVAATIEEYKSGEAGVLAFNTAMLNQQLALVGDAVKTQELLGTLVMMREQYTAGLPQAVAFTTAFTNQEIELEKDKLAVVGLQGTLFALRAEYATGVPTIVAYAKGMLEQATALEKDKLAIDETRGKIKELSIEMTAGTAQTTAFYKGFYDAELAFKTSTVAVSGMEGAISSLIKNMNSGEAQTTAFAKSIYDTRKANLDSVLALQTHAAAVQENTTAVNAGLTQSVAFAEGVLKQKDSLLQLQKTTAETVGTTAELYAEFAKGTSASSLFNAAFVGGVKSMVEWGQSVKSATGSMAGLVEGFNMVSKPLGVTLPQGFKFSIESAKQFVEVFKGMPSTVESVASSLDQAAQSIVSGMVDGFRKGGKDLDDAFKKLSEETGLQFTAEMKAALKPGIIAESTKEYLQKELEAASGSLRFNPAAFQQMVNGMSATITRAIQQNPELKQAGNAILELLSHPSNSEQWFAKMKTLVDGFGSQYQLAGQSVQTLQGQLNNTQGFQAQVKGFGSVEQALASYQRAIAATQKAVEELNTNTQGLFQHALDKADPSKGQFDFGTSDLNKLPGISGGGGAPNTQAIDAAQAKLTAFNTAVAALPTTVATAVTAANNSFSLLNANSPAFVASMTAVAGTLQIFGPAVNQAVINANTYFAALNAMQPAFLASLTSVATTMQMLGPAVNQAVINANTYFATLNANSPAFVASISAAAGQLILFGGGAQALAQEMNAAFATINPNSPTFETALSTMAGNLILLGGGAQALAKEMNDAFATINPDSPTFETGMAFITQSLTALVPAVTSSVAVINKSFGTMGSNLGPILNKIEVDSANVFIAVSSVATSEISKIPPIFSTAVGAINTSLKTLQTNATTVFQGIATQSNQTLGTVSTNMRTMATNVITSIGTIQPKAASVFTAVSVSGVNAAKSIQQTMSSAFSAVASAASSMQSRVSSAFSSISSSANSAANSVRQLQSTINSLQGKTVTITTVYRTVYTTGFAAQGFGPSIVDHPTQLTVGESGPEYVSVIPLKSSSGKHLDMGTRLEMFADSGNIGSNSVNIRMAEGTKTPYPFTSKEWPATPPHKTPYKSHIHDIDNKKYGSGSSRLQPGDYDFEHFAHYAFTHTLEDYNMAETNRRLKLPEYSGVHWDKDRDALDGPITSADKKYHDRLIKEGVYTNYMMYNNEKYYMPSTGGGSGGGGGGPPIPGGGDGGITSTPTSSRPFQAPFDYHQGFTALSGGGGGNPNNVNNITSVGGSSSSSSNTNIQNQSSNSTSISNGDSVNQSTTTSSFQSSSTGGNNFSNLSNNNTSGNVIGSGGGGQGNNTALGAQILAAITAAVQRAVSNISLNLQNTTYMDSNKIYESQKRLFGIRSGSVLK